MTNRKVSLILVTAALALWAPLAGANDVTNPIVNPAAEVPERAYTNAREDGDASDRRRKTDGGHWRGEFRGWSFGKIGEQVIISDVSDFDPLADAHSATVMRFSEIEEDSFNDNKLFQIIDVSAGEELRVRYRVATQFPQQDNLDRPFNTRVRICFGETACSDQSADEVSVNTVDLLARGADADESTGDETLFLDPFEWGEVDYTVAVPDDATRARIEFTATDGTDSGNDQPAGPRQVYFDDFRVERDGTPAPDFANGGFDDFSQAEGDSEEARRDDYFNRKFTGFPDDDQGPLGWYLTDLDEDDYADSAVPFSVIMPERHYPVQGQEAFEAVAGDQVLRFLRFGEFGDDNLDQCVFIGDSDNQSFNFRASVRANQATATDAVLLGVELYESQTSCLLHGDNRLEQERTFDFPEEAEWLTLFSPAVDASGHDWARITLRAQDTEFRQSPDTPEEWLRVYADDLRAWHLPSPQATMDGDVLSFSMHESAPETGVSVAYTLDGEMPDDASPEVSPGTPVELNDETVDDGAVELRAVARKSGWGDSPAQVETLDLEGVSSSSSSSSGCTAGTPLLPLFAFLAMAGWRFRRTTNSGQAPTKTRDIPKCKP